MKFTPLYLRRAWVCNLQTGQKVKKPLVYGKRKRFDSQEEIEAYRAELVAKNNIVYWKNENTGKWEGEYIFLVLLDLKNWI